MSEIEKITTHEDDAAARLLHQYKGKPNIEGLVKALASNLQEAEDAIFDLIVSRRIDSAVGEQLDKLGELVGVERQGFDDDFYRILLYVQIGQNTSQGNHEKVATIFKLLTEANRVHLLDFGNGEIQLNTDGTIDSDKVGFVFNNMEDVVASGVRIDHIVCYTDESFAFDGSNTSAAGAGFGTVVDSNIGGKLAVLHKNIVPFAFAGADIFAEGFGSLKDPLVGGNLIGV